MTFTGTPPESPQHVRLLGEREIEESLKSSETLELLRPPLIKSNPSRKKHKDSGDSFADFIVKLAKSISESFVMIQNNTKEAATKVSDTTKVVLNDIQEWHEQKKKPKLNNETALNIHNFRNPLSILLEHGCQACILSSSDQHITFLLTNIILNPSGKNKHEFNDPTQLKSLLQMSFIPCHKQLVSKTDPQSDPFYNQKILTFLSKYRFDLTSQPESDSSFFKAAPRKFMTPKDRVIFISNRIVPTNKPHASSEKGISTFHTTEGFDVELISPASNFHIKSAMCIPKLRLVQETAQLFQQVTLPFIKTAKETTDPATSHSYNLAVTNDYIMTIDTSWTSHPDTSKVPEDTWYQHPAVNELHCITIAKDTRIATLRDLRASHIAMLKAILSDGYKVLQDRYGVQKDQLLVYVCYQPKYHRFKVHFSALENSATTNVEEYHLLTDIIQNLKFDGEFYAKRTLCYRLNEADDLYQRFQNHKITTLGDLSTPDSDCIAPDEEKNSNDTTNSDKTFSDETIQLTSDEKLIDKPTQVSDTQSNKSDDDWVDV